MDKQSIITNNIKEELRKSNNVVGLTEQRVGTREGKFENVITVQRANQTAFQEIVEEDGNIRKKEGNIVFRKAPEGPPFRQECFQDSDGKISFLGRERPI